MIIKSLTLKNIRSYKDGLIDFPLGKTLFEGDVGAGKSTLLMAVEFALFGLGDVKPAALLKNKASGAEVVLVFSVDGKDYKVFRGLERKRDIIGQTDGVLDTPEGRIHLSPSELKEKILGILDFKEPVNPNAQSVIYRYAVFTPQEEMKAILSLGSDLRVQTLRKAFGLEDYKTAEENARQVLSRVEKKITTFESASLDLETLDNSTLELQTKLEKKKEGYGALKAKREEADTALKKLRDEQQVLHTKETRLSALTTEITLLTSSVLSKNGEAVSLAGDADKIERKRTPIVLKIEGLRAILNPAEKSQDEIQADITQHKLILDNAQREDAKIAGKLNDYLSVQTTGICPVCDTRAEPEGFSEKVRAKNEEKLRSLSQLQALQNHQLELERLLKSKQEYDQAQSDIGIHQESANEYDRQIRSLREKSTNAAKEATESQGRLDAAQLELRGLKNLKTELEDLANKVARAQSDFNTINEEAAKAWQELQDDQKKIDENTATISKKEGYRARVDFLKEYRIWIEDYFIKTLETIEKHVMLTINQEFTTEFQKWVGILLEDSSKAASIDDTFTPIVEQDGAEQDVRYLSGGERTAVALAYRLALNCVVRRVSLGMKSNLLILDEPTDGFSKEQLPKVREILDELQCPQVVMVSHEKELESFADQIVRVYKVNGESKIDAGIGLESEVGQET